MNIFLLFLIYAMLTLFGASLHYFKKLYVDNTLDISLLDYLVTNKAATFRTLTTIVGIAYSLTMQDTSDLLSFSEAWLALTSGYTADSSLNKV